MTRLREIKAYIEECTKKYTNLSIDSPSDTKRLNVGPPVRIPKYRRGDVGRHQRLSRLAEKWMRSLGGCEFVMRGMYGTHGEHPDCIGFFIRGVTADPFSIVVESVTSQYELCSDGHKTFRRYPNLGMGNFRFYLSDAKDIDLNVIPEHWGYLAATISEIGRSHDTLDIVRTPTGWNDRSNDMGVNESPFHSFQVLSHERIFMAHALRHLIHGGLRCNAPDAVQTYSSDSLDKKDEYMK